jgi:hypothetical protein
LKNKIIKDLLILSALFVLLAIIVFDEISLWFLGMGIVFIGIILLNVINR